MGDNGEAIERRSAYAKASAFAEATAYAKATAAALCDRTVKTADKTADKYDPPSRLRASAFAEPTAATSSCPTLVHLLQYVYEGVRLVISGFRLRVYAFARQVRCLNTPSSHSRIYINPGIA